MRAITVVGALLIGAGLFVLLKGASYTSDKSVLKVGPLEAKVSQEHEIPPWAGGAAIAAGVLLLVAGLRKGR
jgi:uncharacterized membrane protein